MKGPAWWHHVASVASAECAVTRAALGIAALLSAAAVISGGWFLRITAGLTLACLATQLVLHLRTDVLRSRALAARPRYFDPSRNTYI